ncbi:MAG TPA: hypothetical protein VGD59_15515 [Acidisarcina sp.]
MTQESFKVFRSLRLAALAMSLAASSAYGQYPGSPAKKPVGVTEQKLRSTAVLEWVGEPGKPSASRIVPIAVWDGERYQAGGLYLAKPEPLAVEDETEYELEQAGVPQGQFVIYHPGQVDRNWFGYGVWHPLPPKKAPKPAASKGTARVVTEVDPDRPTFVSKSRTGGSSSDAASTGKPGGSTGGAGKSGSSSPGTNAPDTAAADTASADKSGSGGASSPAGADPNSPAGATDPDRPTLHKRSTADGASSGSDAASDSGAKTHTEVDADRPTLRKHSRPADTSGASTASTARDPDRPNLHRGGLAAGDPALQESRLEGMPPNLQQMAAVSDTGTAAERPFAYQWSNADDAARMKAAVEDIARKALATLGPTQGFGSAMVINPSAKTTRSAARARAQAAERKTSQAAAAIPLADETFKAYELSPSGGATVVLTASSGEGPSERDVTVICQPDLYGTPRILLQSVADAAHLDMTPRMKLVDAVDTEGDNRAALIFELRSESDRQFAIYRVSRGRAEQVFATDPLPLGTTRD